MLQNKNQDKYQSFFHTLITAYQKRIFKIAEKIKYRGINLLKKLKTSAFTTAKR